MGAKISRELDSIWEQKTLNIFKLQELFGNGKFLSEKSWMTWNMIWGPKCYLQVFSNEYGRRCKKDPNVAPW